MEEEVSVVVLLTTGPQLVLTNASLYFDCQAVKVVIPIMVFLFRLDKPILLIIKKQAGGGGAFKSCMSRSSVVRGRAIMLGPTIN